MHTLNIRSVTNKNNTIVNWVELWPLLDNSVDITNVCKNIFKYIYITSY